VWRVAPCLLQQRHAPPACLVTMSCCNECCIDTCIAAQLLSALPTTPHYLDTYCVAICVQRLNTTSIRQRFNSQLEVRPQLRRLAGRSASTMLNATHAQATEENPYFLTPTLRHILCCVVAHARCVPRCGLYNFRAPPVDVDVGCTIHPAWPPLPHDAGRRRHASRCPGDAAPLLNTHSTSMSSCCADFRCAAASPVAFAIRATPPALHTRQQQRATHTVPRRSPSTAASQRPLCTHCTTLSPRLSRRSAHSVCPRSTTAVSGTPTRWRLRCDCCGRGESARDALRRTENQ